METLEFEKLKQMILLKAKKEKACKEGFKAALLATNKKELLKAIRENFGWSLKYNIVTAEFLDENFSSEELKEAGIFTSGKHEVHSGFAFACGSSTVIAFGSSDVYAFDSSSIIAFDSSKVEAYDSSTVEAQDLSKVYAYNSSTVEAQDLSKVYAYNSSTVYAFDSSKVYTFGLSKKIENNN